MYGVIQHRLLYAVGVANGIFPGNDGQFNGNNSKDFYGRVDYKFGGMGLDGDTGDKETPAQNWRDDSFRVGAFFYRGNGAGVNLASTTDAGLDVNVQDAHFLRTGFFASVYFKDLNVFGGFLRGSDTLRQLDPASGDFLQETTPDYHAWFAQADYVFYPWLHGAMRYETVTPGDRRLQSPRTGTANVSALIRANVKAMLEYQRDLRQSENHSLNAIVRFAF